MFPYALIIHLCVTIWMFGNNEVLKSVSDAPVGVEGVVGETEGWVELTKHVVVGLFQGVINTGIVGGEGNVEDQYEAWRQEQEEVRLVGDMCFAVDAPLTHNCCDDLGPG